MHLPLITDQIDILSDEQFTRETKTLFAAVKVFTGGQHAKFDISIF